MTSSSHGLTHRLRRELLNASERGAAWFCAEAKCVVLLDIRRAALLWSHQPHEALDNVPAPTSGLYKAKVTVHVDAQAREAR